MRALLPAFALALSACAEAGNACGNDELDAGGVAGTLDGADWTAADATWIASGSSVQIVTADAGAGRVTLVAQTTTDGEDLAAALDAGAFPVEVTLKSGAEGGFATFYPSTGSDSYATGNADGGRLVLTALQEDELFGCFGFTAATEDGDALTLDGGAFRATTGG